MLPLAKTYEVDITLAQILPNLILVRAKSNKFGQIESFLQGVKNAIFAKIYPAKRCDQICSKEAHAKGT